MSAKNSCRDAGLSRSMPCTADVTVAGTADRATPRNDMHWCSASITTPTPLGAQVILEPVGDLLGQPLLHLQVTREQLHHAGQLRQPENAFAGQVADVRDALERQHVVLAQRLHGDAARQHQFVVPLVVRERRQVELPRREHLGVRVGHPPRRVGQMRAVRIPPERHQQIGHGPLGGGQVDLRPATDDVQWRRAPACRGPRAAGSSSPAGSSSVRIMVIWRLH